MARLAKPRSAKSVIEWVEEVPHESLQKLIFDGNSLDSAALHSLPQNRRGPFVVRDHGQNQRAVIALCELRPVQCDHEIGATSGNKFKPVMEPNHRRKVARC